MIETELAKHIVDWLCVQHWDVYQEVRFTPYRGSPIADIVAVRNKYIWIIETKMSLTFDVLEQASKWKTEFRSVAVPQAKSASGKSKRKDRALMAKEYYKVGLLVDCGGVIVEYQGAPLMREYARFSRFFYANKLKEEQKNGEYAQAGSRGGGYYTPYGQTIRNVKRYIEQHPGCTMKDIINELGKSHYATTQSAKTNLRTALNNWEDWCLVENGKYYIHEP